MSREAGGEQLPSINYTKTKASWSVQESSLKSDNTNLNNLRPFVQFLPANTDTYVILLLSSCKKKTHM